MNNRRKILPGQKMLSMKVTDDRGWYANDESYFCEFLAAYWTVTVKEQYDGYSKIAFSFHERYIQFCLLEGEITQDRGKWLRRQDSGIMTKLPSIDFRLRLIGFLSVFLFFMLFIWCVTNDALHICQGVPLYRRVWINNNAIINIVNRYNLVPRDFLRLGEGRLELPPVGGEKPWERGCNRWTPTQWDLSRKFSIRWTWWEPKLANVTSLTNGRGPGRRSWYLDGWTCG